MCIRDSWEGMALAPLEAMACGRPVLLTDVPGSRECVPPGELGRSVVPPENPGPMAERLVEFLSDRIECERRGVLARAHVADHHDIRQVIPQVAAIYRTIVRSRVVPVGRRSRVPQRF